jgi:NAD(P)-dependent dehydrogenase (short-subunit alcohol dehydrogenase family)
MRSLQSKVAIVTGASSGIGHATARLFAREGARLVLSGRDEIRLEALARAIRDEGGKAVTVVGDLREEATAKRLVDQALSRFGQLDVAFNNAGSAGTMAPVHELSPAGWREVIETNLTSAFLCAKHQVPALLERKAGALVFTGSFVGHGVGMPGMSAYAASKAGLVGLVQTLAVELGPHGIRVNAVLPGGTDTPANVANAPGADPGVREFVEKLHALRRMARPEEIAQTVLHLASDAGSFITGAAIHVDGGVSVTRT